MKVFLLLSLLLVSTLFVHANPSAQSSVAATVRHEARVQAKGPGHGKAQIKELATGKNAFVGRLWLAAHAKVPKHRDPTEEYLYIISGSGVLSIDGVEREIGTGMAIFMPAGSEVSFVNGAKPLVALQVFAGTESAQKYATWPNVNPSLAK